MCDSHWPVELDLEELIELDLEEFFQLIELDLEEFFHSGRMKLSAALIGSQAPEDFLGRASAGAGRSQKVTLRARIGVVTPGQGWRPAHRLLRVRPETSSRIA